MVMVSSSLQPARGSCCSSRGVPEVVRKVGACEVHQQRHFVLECFFLRGSEWIGKNLGRGEAGFVGARRGCWPWFCALRW